MSLTVASSRNLEGSVVHDRAFGAFLFDMDGTILTSIAATERVWSSWARRHKLDVETFLPTIHGVRAVETIQRLGLAGIEIQAEVDWLTDAEMLDLDGVAPIAGAAAFLDALPRDRWAIVTSAPRNLCLRRLAAAGLRPPNVLVCGDDVTNGKPAPDCFLLGAELLGVPIGDCLVFEDAPAGIQAAEAAGASVLVITATHHAPMDTRHPRIGGYEAVQFDAPDLNALHLRLR